MLSMLQSISRVAAAGHTRQFFQALLRQQFGASFYQPPGAQQMAVKSETISFAGVRMNYQSKHRILKGKPIKITILCIL